MKCKSDHGTSRNSFQSCNGLHGPWPPQPGAHLLPRLGLPLPLGPHTGCSLCFESASPPPSCSVNPEHAPGQICEDRKHPAFVLGCATAAERVCRSWLNLTGGMALSWTTLQGPPHQASFPLALSQSPMAGDADHTALGHCGFTASHTGPNKTIFNLYWMNQ